MGRRRKPDISRFRLAAGKLARLGAGGWWLLVQAQWFILRAAAVVRRRPQGMLIRELSTAGDPTTAEPEDRDEVVAVGLALDRVARNGFGRPLCLVRSMALHRLLARRGLPGSRIRVGVRMNGSTFEAHAWVEWSDEVIGDDPEYVALFRPFSELQPAAGDLSWQSDVKS